MFTHRDVPMHPFIQLSMLLLRFIQPRFTFLVTLFIMNIPAYPLDYCDNDFDCTVTTEMIEDSIKGFQRDLGRFEAELPFRNRAVRKAAHQKRKFEEKWDEAAATGFWYTNPPYMAMPGTGSLPGVDCSCFHCYFYLWVHVDKEMDEAEDALELNRALAASTEGYLKKELEQLRELEHGSQDQKLSGEGDQSMDESDLTEFIQ